LSTPPLWKGPWGCSSKGLECSMGKRAQVVTGGGCKEARGTDCHRQAQEERDTHSPACTTSEFRLLVPWPKAEPRSRITWCVWIGWGG